MFDVYYFHFGFGLKVKKNTSLWIEYDMMYCCGMYLGIRDIVFCFLKNTTEQRHQ